MKKFALSPFAFAPLMFIAACVNVDNKVAEKPSRYWKAPADAKPDREIRPGQIRTEKIVAPEDVLPVSDKMLAGETLTLTDLVDIALENNTSTRQYWYQAKIYAAQKGQVDSQYFPYVSTTMGIARNKIRQVSPTPIGVGTYWDTGYGPSLQINWLLFDFFKRERQSDSARESLRAANFDYNQGIQDLVLSVNVAYFDLYNAMGYVKTAQANLDDAKTSYESSKAKFDSEVGNKQDMLRALANFKNAEFELESAYSQIEARRADLAKVLGIEVDASLKITDEFVVPQSEDTEKQIETLIANALRERQTIMSAYAKMRSAEYQAYAQENNYLPSISGVGSFQWTDYTGDELYRTPSNNYSVGIQLSWSIFEGFNKQYQVISAKAQQRIAAMQLKQQQIDIIGDVWSSFYTYKSALKQVSSANSAVDASKEAYDAMKAAYDSGVSTLTDLLNAQSLLAASRQKLVDAESLLATSIARLAHSTGSLTSNIPPEVIGDMDEVNEQQL